MRISKLPTLFLALLACSTAAAQAFDYDDIADGRFRPAQLAGIRPPRPTANTTPRSATATSSATAMPSTTRARPCCPQPRGGRRGPRFARPRHRHVVRRRQPQARHSRLCDRSGRRGARGRRRRTDLRHSFTTRYLYYDGRRLREILLGIPSPRDAVFTPDGRKHRLFELQQPVCLQYRTTGHAADHPRRPLERDDQRHDRLGLRGGGSASRAPSPSRPTRGASPTLRFDESRVPLFEMMRYDGALYNRAYDFKYPQGGRRQFGGDAPRLRPRNGPYDEGRHRRRHHAIHSPHRLDAARGVVVRDPRPAVSSRSSSADWRPRRSRRRRRSSRRSTASVRPAMWPTKPTVRSAGSTADAASHYAGDGDGLDAPLPRRARRNRCGRSPKGAGR